MLHVSMFWDMHHPTPVVEHWLEREIVDKGVNLWTIRVYCKLAGLLGRDQNNTCGIHVNV